MTASDAAALIASHCSSSEPRRAGARTVKYGAGPSGIHVREAARHAPAAAGLARPRARVASITDRVERREAVPRDRGLERLADHAAGDEGVAQVGRAQERLAPGADRVLAVRRVPRRRPTVPPWSAASSSARAIHGLDRVVGRLEARARAARPPCEAPVSAASPGSSRRQLRRVQAALRRARAPPRRPRAKSGKRHAGRRRGSGRSCSRIHASVITPRMPSEPISIRSGLGPGARARQAPRLDRPARRDRGDRLDEVVDVRVERREVAAGARRDPAAERRELERLREVAQRQAVRAQLVLERRARSRRPGSAPRARRGRPRARGRAGRGRS